jgi:hypothetical protein
VTVKENAGILFLANERVYRITESLRRIAESDLAPSEVHGLMKPFMYCEVTDFLEPAISYLNELRATWRG